MRQYLCVPYHNFKEKTKLVKEYKKRRFYVEDIDGYLYCYRNQINISKCGGYETI